MNRSWENFYDALYNEEFENLALEANRQTRFGPSEEVLEAVYMISDEDEKAARELLRHAVEAGVVFAGQEVADLQEYVDDALLNRMAGEARNWEAMDIDGLSDRLKPEIIREAAASAGADYAEYGVEDLLGVDYPPQVQRVLSDWKLFYASYDLWPDSVLSRRVRDLKAWGPSEEVAEVIDYLYGNCEDEVAAFIGRALDAGIRFSPEDSINMLGACDSPDLIRRLVSACTKPKDKALLEEAAFYLDEDEFLETLDDVGVDSRDVEYEGCVIPSIQHLYEVYSDRTAEENLEELGEMDELEDKELVLEILYCAEYEKEQRDFARELLSRALDEGMSFDLDEIEEFQSYLPQPLLERVFLESDDEFEEQILEFKGRISDRAIREVARKEDFDLAEYGYEKMDEDGLIPSVQSILKDWGAFYEASELWPVEVLATRALQVTDFPTDDEGYEELDEIIDELYDYEQLAGLRFALYATTYGIRFDPESILDLSEGFPRERDALALACADVLGPDDIDYLWDYCSPSTMNRILDIVAERDGVKGGVVRLGPGVYIPKGGRGFKSFVVLGSAGSFLKGLWKGMTRRE